MLGLLCNFNKLFTFAISMISTEKKHVMFIIHLQGHTTKLCFVTIKTQTRFKSILNIMQHLKHNKSDMYL